MKERPERSGLRPRRDAHREDTGEVLATGSTHPMAESCLVLTKRGVSGDTLVTMRHADSRHDSFKPAPVRIGARERRSSPGGARRPRPFVRGRPKAAARMGSPAMIPDAGNIGADEALRLRQQRPDRAIASQARRDRKHFRRFPGRRWLLRHPHQAEVGENALAGRLPELPPGWTWFMAVRRVGLADLVRKVCAAPRQIAANIFRPRDRAVPASDGRRRS